MQGNGEQKGGLKDRKISWRIRKKKEKLQKQLKKQEQKEKERQLKIKNSQVFSNQTGRVKQKTESAFLVVFLLIGSLFSSPAKKKEKHDIKRFEKNKEEAPAALLYLKQDVKDYTESLDRYLNTIGRQIDLATEQKEIEEIKTRLDEIEDRFTQTKEKYEIIKQRHHIEEKESMLGLTKTKEVHVEGLSLEARQSVLASTAFITASLENSSEKIKQARTELEVKAKEFHIEPEEVLEENKVVATIHAGKEKIEITEKPFQKKNVIARPQEAVTFLKEKNKMMSQYEERIEAIHRASFDETHIEVLESYLKELIKMNEDLNQTLSEYKEKQEKYNIHGLIAFEDIRSFDRYRLTVSDVKIREILRHTTGEKENIEDCIKEQKEKMEKKESKEQEVKKEIEQQEEKEVDDAELLSTEEMENSIEKIRALLKKQEEVLSDFHTTLQKSSVRVRKESHFGRFRHLLSSFASMAFGTVGTLLFRNPLMKTLVAGFALNHTIKNLRRAVRPEMQVEVFDIEPILKQIKTRQDCIDKTIDIYSSTLTEIEWMKEDFEQEFKAYESIHKAEYQTIMNDINELKDVAEKELKVAEKMKEKTKKEKQKVLTLNKK